MALIGAPIVPSKKKTFGGAVDRIPYVECDPQGFNPQVALCQASGIEAYPTWVIDGEIYLGVQPLGTLARLSGFEQPAVKPAAKGEDSPASGASGASDGYSPAR
ncbi:MAG: hypothetical protein HC800_03995 [Phormidesmis sp. RL_2_1]|nr:hypothetical protein [Phormidesmis sp. RL_2_1]